MLKTLRSRLLLFFILISSLPVIIIGYISYKSAESALRTEIEQNLTILSEDLSLQIQTFASERISDVKLLAKNHVLTDPPDPIKVRHALQSFNEAYSVYDGLVFAKTDGKVYAATNELVTNEDISQRRWFNPAKQGIYFSDIYCSPLVKKPLLILAAPVINARGKLSGIVSSSINLEYFWQTIDNFSLQRKRMGLSGTAFVINKDGLIIAHPDRSTIFYQNYFKSKGLSKEKLQELLKTRQVFNNPVNNMVTSFSQVNNLESFNNNWVVVVSVPEEELYLPLKKLIIKYLLTMSLILIATNLLSFYLASTIEKPIKQLVDAVVDFSAGKQIPSLTSSSYDEINTLNDTFLTMVSELKEREGELIKSEKLKVVGELAASVAHEIRNPLTTIRGFMQLLDSRDNDEDTKKEYYKITIEELDRINQIITDYLTLAKPEAITQTASADINSILNEILLLLEPNALLKEIIVEKDLAELPPLSLDSNQLKQVFINIIQNSLEATPAGGKLLISTYYSSDYLNIVFEDTGCGMDTSTLKNIGTPFFTTKDYGTGIGLMLCYRIIENMQGTLTIESGLGMGTTCTIKLPVNPEKLS